MTPPQTQKKASVANGVFTALITPFKADGSIDFAQFENLVQRQIEARINGVIPCGTTGEAPTLTREEKLDLIHRCIVLTKGTATKVFAGTGSNSTAESVVFSAWASQQGVDGILVVTPYYNKPSAAGLRAHFTAIADAVSCEVMLYNVPGRTGISLTPATIAELANHPNILSLKEATGNLAFWSDVTDALSKSGKHLSILSGDDPTYLSALTLGAQGIVSVASNIAPRALVDLTKSKDLALFQKHYPLFRDLFVESNPVPVKWLMSKMGLCLPVVRPPLSLLSSENETKLNVLLKSQGDWK